MESFVFKEMNKASRQKDATKIEMYGALASAICFILHSGNKIDTDLSQRFIVYRGFQLSTKEYEEKFVQNQYLNLTGYTSTTLNRNIAKKFAIGISEQQKMDFEKKSVLLEIEFQGDNQFFYLNSKKYSAYPMEKEVLLQDGIRYKVVSIESQMQTIDGVQ